LADPATNPHMADLVLSAKEGYAFSESAGGEIVVTEKFDTTKGTHGYDPNQPKMHATFVAWGAGIKAGAHSVPSKLPASRPPWRRSSAFRHGGDRRAVLTEFPARQNLPNGRDAPLPASRLRQD
jgi:hypothetical protein